MKKQIYIIMYDITNICVIARHSVRHGVCVRERTKTRVSGVNKLRGIMKAIISDNV
jgi:hypothetical protein